MGMKRRRSQRSEQNVTTPDNVATAADVAYQSNFAATKIKGNAASLLLLVVLLCGSVPTPAVAIRGALFRSGRSTAAAAAWRRPMAISAVRDNGIVPPFWITPERQQMSNNNNNYAQPSMAVSLRQLAQWQHDQAMVAKAVKQMLEDSNSNRERKEAAALGLEDRQVEESGANSPSAAHIRFSIPALFGVPTRNDYLTTANKRAVANWPVEEATGQQQLIKRAKLMQPKKRGEESSDQLKQQKKQQLGHFINMAKKFMASYNNDDETRRRGGE